MVPVSVLAHQHVHAGILAPAFVLCPACSSLCRLNEVRTLCRQHADVAGPTQVTADLGCYVCPTCPKGERWFRLSAPGFEGNRRYTTPTRHAVMNLVKIGKMSFEAVGAVARQVLHLPKLHPTTVLRWLREDGESVDLDDHLRRALAVFSGEFAIDEVYDGTFYVIRVTDPINCIELMTQLGEGSPTAEDVAQVLRHLYALGFRPALIVTDGSSLYPKVLAEIFPDAAHQSCVFHFMQLANEKLRAAYRAAVASMPQPKKRKRGRPKKLGRPREDKRKRLNIAKVRKVRYILFMRKLDGDQQALLDEALRLCPALVEVRRLVTALHTLFDSMTPEQAQERRVAITTDPGFKAVVGASTILATLADDTSYARFTRYLDYTNAERTSNHAERENREFRKRQKAHYKLRTERTMTASLALLTTRHAIPPVGRRLVPRKPPVNGNPNVQGVVTA